MNFLMLSGEMILINLQIKTPSFNAFTTSSCFSTGIPNCSDSSYNSTSSNTPFNPTKTFCS